MSTSPHEDPLKKIYRDSFVENPKHQADLTNRDTALLCIDMQYLDAAEGHGLFKDYESSPIPLEEMRYYFDRLKDTVLPNVHNLQNCFRSHGLEVIHVRIQSLTQDGRDRSMGHKRLELHAAPGSGDACFLEEVAPVGDEIIINKTASGVFSSTNLNYVLNNLGISSLFIVGVYTNECVETTVRAACDLGYLVTMVDDCCATQTPELHEASLQTLRNRYARIVTTEEALDDIEQYVKDGETLVRG
ncbi:MAG: cysteine hydrolase [Verrucomicrobiales bacterium]|nr:cysteine hydrolase [Verrucomicrobiales bacterium]